MDKRDQEKFWKNLNEISFYFFVIVGLTHIISGMLYVNEIFSKSSWLVNRLLDVPFFLITYAYIISLVKTILMKKGNYSRLFDVYSVIIGSLIAVIILLFDLMFTNKLPIL
jgi:uncharacterized MAPEG superfamily protein